MTKKALIYIGAFLFIVALLAIPAVVLKKDRYSELLRLVPINDIVRDDNSIIYNISLQESNSSIVFTNSNQVYAFSEIYARTVYSFYLDSSFYTSIPVELNKDGLGINKYKNLFYILGLGRLSANRLVVICAAQANKIVSTRHGIVPFTYYKYFRILLNNKLEFIDVSSINEEELCRGAEGFFTINNSIYYHSKDSLNGNLLASCNSDDSLNFYTVLDFDLLPRSISEPCISRICIGSSIDYYILGDTKKSVFSVSRKFASELSFKGAKSSVVFSTL